MHGVLCEKKVHVQLLHSCSLPLFLHFFYLFIYFFFEILKVSVHRSLYRHFLRFYGDWYVHIVTIQAPVFLSSYFLDVYWDLYPNALNNRISHSLTL